ncbi:hypothetical protein YC2023_099131 [Brassica napus]
MEAISVKRVASSHYVQDDDVKITGSSADNMSLLEGSPSDVTRSLHGDLLRLEVSPTIVFDEYQRMKVLRRHTHPCVIPIVDAHVFPVVDAEGYNCWEVIRSYCSGESLFWAQIGSWARDDDCRLFSITGDLFL